MSGRRWVGPPMVKEVDGQKVWGHWLMEGQVAVSFQVTRHPDGTPALYDEQHAEPRILQELDDKLPPWWLPVGVIGALVALLTAALHVIEYARRLGWLS